MPTPILLLVLYGRWYDEILRYRLEEKGVINAEGYNALPYAWGGQVAAGYLLWDSDILAITKMIFTNVATRFSKCNRFIA